MFDLEHYRAAWWAALNPSNIRALDVYCRTAFRRMYEMSECRFAGHKTPCWVWTGGLNDKGYAKLAIDRKRSYVHRISYEILVGPIPENLTIDHLCRNCACFNPGHLEPVTARENTLRALAAVPSRTAKRTHCVRGHEYTPENTRLTDGGRHQNCRACDRARGMVKNPKLRAAKRAERRAAAPVFTGDGSPSRVLVAGEPLNFVPHRTNV